MISNESGPRPSIVTAGGVGVGTGVGVGGCVAAGVTVAAGVAVGAGVAVRAGVGAGEGVGAGDGVGVGEGVGAAVGLGVGLGVSVGAGVGDGVTVAALNTAGGAGVAVVPARRLSAAPRATTKMMARSSSASTAPIVPSSHQGRSRYHHPPRRLSIASPYGAPRSADSTYRRSAPVFPF